ncbi:hypothetical protein [Cyprinid herpesvirus 2]|nr:hypothetical protein [Cyprinid herpesvirus 2]QIM55346.1 hypothetical protein [Cyprinid herpesvirus 2]
MLCVFKVLVASSAYCCWWFCLLLFFCPLLLLLSSLALGLSGGLLSSYVSLFLLHGLHHVHPVPQAQGCLGLFPLSLQSLSLNQQSVHSLFSQSLNLDRAVFLLTQVGQHARRGHCCICVWTVRVDVAGGAAGCTLVLVSRVFVYSGATHARGVADICVLHFVACLWPWSLVEEHGPHVFGHNVPRQINLLSCNGAPHHLEDGHAQ